MAHLQVNRAEVRMYMNVSYIWTLKIFRIVQLRLGIRRKLDMLGIMKIPKTELPRVVWEILTSNA